MRQATIEELAADPDRLVDLVESGEPIIIVRNGQPIVEMRPCGDEERR